MSQLNSHQQMIYRNLANKIQLGFFQDGDRFPSAQEIADWHRVSYCPVQRALKDLEKDGFIRLCRGKETVILAKPYEDYLNSTDFKQRISTLADLSTAIRLISPSLCMQGLHHIKEEGDILHLTDGRNHIYYEKRLHYLFDKSIRGLGNQIALSLFSDFGTLIGSAYNDILYKQHGDENASTLLKYLNELFLQSLKECQKKNYTNGKQILKKMEQLFFCEIDRYLNESCQMITDIRQNEFSWGPHKGRTKYCDIIAVDMICKINQEIYPVGELLPNGVILADIYHVSEITIRRMIGLLNKLGIVRTYNGIGTRVVCRGDDSILYRLESLNIGSNLKTFLEALQLLAFTCEDVLQYTLLQCPHETRNAIINALSKNDQKASMVATISVCLQIIVRYCPLKTIRDVYSKITLLLLNGSVLRLSETGDMEVPEWPSMSKALSESLIRRDDEAFSAEFRRMTEMHFVITKQKLLEIGIEGIETIVDPVKQEDQKVNSKE